MRTVSFTCVLALTIAAAIAQTATEKSNAGTNADLERFERILKELTSLATGGSADPVCDNCRKIQASIAGCLYDPNTQTCSDSVCVVTERHTATCDYHPLGTVNKRKAQWEAAADGGKIYIRDLGVGNCNADPDLYTFFNPYVGCDTCALAPQQIRCQAAVNCQGPYLEIQNITGTFECTCN